MESEKFPKVAAPFFQVSLTNFPKVSLHSKASGMGLRSLKRRLGGEFGPTNITVVPLPRRLHDFLAAIFSPGIRCSSLMRLDALSFSFSFARFFYISVEAVFKSFWLFVLIKVVIKSARAANRIFLNFVAKRDAKGLSSIMIRLHVSTCSSCSSSPFNSAMALDCISLNNSPGFFSSATWSRNSSNITSLSYSPRSCSLITMRPLYLVFLAAFFFALAVVAAW
jgi:hypothetical protein